MIESIVVGALAVNCYLAPLAGKAHQTRPCLVVDPGGDADAIISRLKRRRWHPAIIVLTHGHFDHLGALAELTAAFAGSAEPPVIAIHAADAAYLGPESKRLHLRDFRTTGAEAFLEQFWREPPPALRFLAEGDPVGHFQVLVSPGHTPGGICLYDAADGMLLSGDTLFAEGVGRVDLPGGDGALLNRSLDRLLALPSSTVVYPGHGRSARIVVCRQALRWS